MARESEFANLRRYRYPMKTFVSRLRAVSLLVMFAAVGFSGCTYVQKPVGDRPVRLDPAEWQGEWWSDGSMVKVTVINAAKGLLRIEDVEKRVAESDEPTDVELRISGDALFFSLKVEDEEEPDADHGYIWGYVIRDGDKLTVFLPNAKKFAELLESGVLKGQTDDVGNVTLLELTAAQLAAIVDGKYGSEVWSETNYVLERR